MVSLVISPAAWEGPQIRLVFNLCILLTCFLLGAFAFYSFVMRLVTHTNKITLSKHSLLISLRCKQFYPTLGEICSISKESSMLANLHVRAEGTYGLC